MSNPVNSHIRLKLKAMRSGDVLTFAPDEAVKAQLIRNDLLRSKKYQIEMLRHEDGSRTFTCSESPHD